MLTTKARKWTTSQYLDAQGYNFYIIDSTLQNETTYTLSVLNMNKNSYKTIPVSSRKRMNMMIQLAGIFKVKQFQNIVVN